MLVNLSIWIQPVSSDYIFEDAGYEGVRHLAASDFVACAQHGRAEVISAFHRKFQERAISARLYEITLREFLNETRGGACRCLRYRSACSNAPSSSMPGCLQRSFCVL